MGKWSTALVVSTSHLDGMGSDKTFGSDYTDSGHFVSYVQCSDN